MSIQNFRKALGLLIVDTLIIIGIFVLQFRTDSSIIEKIGNLQISLEKAEESPANSNGTPLINKLRLSYNGFNLFFDNQNPIKVNSANDSQEITQVTLTSYKKTSDLSYDFDFTNNVKLHVFLTSLNSDSNFSINAVLPANIKSIEIPYNYSSNMKIKKEDSNRIIFEDRKNAWELEGYSFANKYVTFSHIGNSISYAPYQDTKEFTFDLITELAIANPENYRQTISSIKQNLISAFNSNTIEANITEQTAVSYIAAMSESGHYNQAIENIPQSLKNSPERTYLSAPYLNTLASMDLKLEAVIKSNQNLISSSAQNGSLNLLGIRNIAFFLYIHPNQNEVTTFLNKVAKIEVKNASLSQIVGIIQLYNDLLTLNEKYAAILHPLLDPCVDKIASMCNFNGSIITISENDTFISVVQAVEIGVALLRYGIISGNVEVQKAGYAIVNSYISESSSFDLRTLSNIYPIIAYDNWYYPHFAKINDSNKVWAWTCARDIKVNISSEEVQYIIDFPESLTHYVILKGVPRFRTIYIYNMAFRTDPRFETYNSSGYVYKRENQTLLLKSRHKSRLEEIRIDLYDEKAEATPVSTATSETSNNSSQEKASASENTSSTEVVKTTTNETSSASDSTSTSSSQNNQTNRQNVNPANNPYNNPYNRAPGPNYLGIPQAH